MEVKMRTLALVLSSFILIYALQSCNESYNSDNIVNPKKISTGQTLVQCCNLGRPENCDGIGSMSLLTDIGDIEIDCECCQEIWDYYGGTLPPDKTLPHTIIGTFVCIPNKEEESK